MKDLMQRVVERVGVQKVRRLVEAVDDAVRAIFNSNLNRSFKNSKGDEIYFGEGNIQVMPRNLQGGYTFEVDDIHEIPVEESAELQEATEYVSIQFISSEPEAMKAEMAKLKALGLHVYSNPKVLHRFLVSKGPLSAAELEGEKRNPSVLDEV